MKPKFNFKSAVMRLLMLTLCFIVGVGSDVMVAAAANLPDAGKTAAGAATGSKVDGTAAGTNGGIATETQGRAEGDEEFYQKEIDERIIKIRPMSTPIDQISRHAKAKKSKSFEVKYYSVGTRPFKTTLSQATTKQQSGTCVALTVADPSIFTVDDTIRCVGVKAITKEDGTLYTNNDVNVPDLVLCVIGTDPSTGNPNVYAVNGYKDGNNQTIWLPIIPVDTVLIRMGKACAELDVQTGRFNNLPLAEIQYCQNFMIQIEQSTFDKLAAKEVDWDFSDLEEDALYDMRLAMENTFLFGVKRKITHALKGSLQWFTGGIWYMAGKDIEVGEYDADTEETIITQSHLVDIAKDLFVGTGVGEKQKIIFCGSEMLAALSKIKTENSNEMFQMNGEAESWGLKFKSWSTNFGELLVIHHEMFDYNGMSDCGFALDPTYLCKRTHIGWGRHLLDLKSAGVRNTDAVVLQEVCCLYLRYAKAHARLKLASAA